MDLPVIDLIDKACELIGISLEGSLIERAIACCEAMGILSTAESEPVARVHQHSRTPEGADKKVRKIKNKQLQQTEGADAFDAFVPEGDGDDGYKSDNAAMELGAPGEDAMTDASEVRDPVRRFFRSVF